MLRTDRLRFAILGLLAVVLPADLSFRVPLIAGERETINQPPESPVPLRWILINPDRLPQELERVKQGTLVQLARSDFEEQLRQAGNAVQAQKNPPRLTEGRYQAVLADSALVGVGQWHVLHVANQPALMPLPSFNLSLRRQVTAHKPEAPAPGQVIHPGAGASGLCPAALGELGKSPALLLEEAGTHRIDLEWSLRGDTRPDGLHFELKVPSSPIAALELYLPAGWQVSLPEGGLVTGPQPLRREVLPAALQTLVQSEKPLAPAVPGGSRLWTIHLGGVSRLPLILRPSDRPGPTRVVVQRQQSTQTLYPDALEAKYELDLEVQTRSVSELICECDPGLRPYAVSLANLDTWEVRRGPNPESPSLLVLKLKEPIHEGSLRVSCLAPLRSVAKGGPPGPAFPWTSPGLRLQGGIPRGETLILRLHPELRLTSWEPGGFRLIDTQTEIEADQKVSWQRLRLVGGGILLPAGKQPQRPTAALQAHAVEYRARQLAWWQPGPTRSSLTLQIHYEASVGQLFDLPVQLPAGWEIDRVEMSPPGLLSGWRLFRDRSLLLVELQKPLCPQDQARGGPAMRTGTLTVGLTAPAVKLPAVGRKTLPFPESIPLGARFREGALGLSIDPAFQAAEQRTALTPAQPQEEGPWKSQLPAPYFAYRQQVPKGTLVLQRRPVQLRVSATTDVQLSAGPLALQTQLEIEVEAGTTESLEVRASAPSGGWDFRSLTPGIQLVRTELLTEPETARAAGLLAALTPASRAGPLLAASRLPLLAPGPCWRITFSRPLRPQDRVVLQASAAVPHSHVPLLQVPGARRLEGEVRLRLSQGDRFDVRTHGLQEVSAPPTALEGRPLWRVFRLGPAPATLDLVRFLPEQGAEAPARNGVLSRTQLVSSLGPDGTLQHQFRFCLTGWSQATLPVWLPPGARLLAARVDGRWLDQLPTEEPADDQPLQLPVPRSSGGPEGESRSQNFEIVYLTDVAPWWLWSRLESAEPKLPLDPINLQRRFSLPAGIQPAGQQGAESQASAGNDHARHSRTAGLLAWSGVRWEEGSPEPARRLRRAVLLRDRSAGWRQPGGRPGSGPAGAGLAAVGEPGADAGRLALEDGPAPAGVPVRLAGPGRPGLVLAVRPAADRGRLAAAAGPGLGRRLVRCLSRPPARPGPQTARSAFDPDQAGRLAGRQFRSRG